MCTQIMDFVKSREDFISQFLNHLGTSAMMDLLLQMVAAPENDKNRIELAEVSFSRYLPPPPPLLSLPPSLSLSCEVMLLFFCAQWLRDQGIVERLVDLVGNEAGSEVSSCFIALISSIC